MTNTFMNQMKRNSNIALTENGGVTRKTTQSAVMDMFALGGAYRQRSDADVILLFKNAFEEDRLLALKCLFYLRDARGGQGERRFFRVAYRWLCENYPRVAATNLEQIPEFGRWDDLIYICEGTNLEAPAFNFIKYQLMIDKQSKTPSLLAKWMPSQNASSQKTKELGFRMANFLGMTSKEYRKTLSVLREKIKVLECLMSENRWDEIEFDKIPSRAGLIYKNAFAHKEVTAARYKAFMDSKETKVHANVLYPHDIAHRALDWQMARKAINDPERKALNKYWDCLPNYYGNKEENAIAIVDVSGSMHGVPMEAAVSMGAYVADKSHGPFANHFITFSADPELVKFEGVDIVDKFNRCVSSDWGMNTNLEAVFDMLLNIATHTNVSAEDIPHRLYIFSDMEFDQCVTFDNRTHNRWDRLRCVRSESEVNSDLEQIAMKWRQFGYELPEVVFWNLNARNDRIAGIGRRFSYVSGFSPVLMQQILSGKTAWDLMIEKLMDKRYSTIKI